MTRVREAGARYSRPWKHGAQMLASPDKASMPPEIQFLGGPGGGLVFIVALAALGITVAWARQPGHPDRYKSVWAAGMTSLLVLGITLVAMRAGW